MSEFADVIRAKAEHFRRRGVDRGEAEDKLLQEFGSEPRTLEYIALALRDLYDDEQVRAVPQFCAPDARDIGKRQLRDMSRGMFFRSIDEPDGKVYYVGNAKGEPAGYPLLADGTVLLSGDGLLSDLQTCGAILDPLDIEISGLTRAREREVTLLREE